MTRRSAAGLDWLTFFVGNAQTGFGPFIAVYLTSVAWTQTEIGAALSLGTVVAMMSQVPAGAIVDRLRDKRVAAFFAGSGVAAAALLFALSPSKLSVLLALTLHSLASSLLGPAIAAISLALVGHAALGGRLGRNARFAALGNGIAAAALGAIGSYVSNRAVFWLTCGLMVPGLVAVTRIRRVDLKSVPVAAGPATRHGIATLRRDLLPLFLDRRFLVFAAAAVLFFFDDAGLLPAVGSAVTKHSGNLANLVIAASIVLPQLISAGISPWVGRSADRWGRRPMLLLGFAAMPLRGLLLSLSTHPSLVILVQGLDGLSAATFGVMMPLVIADITKGTRHFNVMVGFVGLAIAGGAALSTIVAGMVADSYGHATVFLVLAAGGLVSVLLLLFAMPETREVPVAPEHTLALRREVGSYGGMTPVRQPISVSKTTRWR